MTNHKLDEEVEDILLHYGIKGMKWDVIRTPEQIQADAKANLGAAGEAMENAGDKVLGNDSVMGELGDVLSVIFGGGGNLKKETKQLVDASKDKLEDIGSEVKKRGYKMLENMFGTVEQQRARDKAEKKKFLKSVEAGWKANGGKVTYENKSKSSKPKPKGKAKPKPMKKVNAYSSKIGNR